MTLREQRAQLITEDQIKKIAALLTTKSPSLVLAGPSVEGHEQGYSASASIMLLNILLGNVNQTIESQGEFPFSRLQAKSGGTGDLLSFTEDAKAKKLDVVFLHGCNPAYSAPDAIAIDKALNNIALKVAIAQFPDETTELADIVLPVASYLEDWGTHVAAYQATQSVISMQQPLMEKINEGSRGLGEILISLIKQTDNRSFDQYKDYYGYLRHAHAAMPKSLKSEANDDVSWNAALQKGIIKIPSKNKLIKPKVATFTSPELQHKELQNNELYLIPSPRLGLWDGRHANIPWLQEAPDQLSKLVWDSWAELHPETAAKLGIKSGDIVKISSKHAELKVQAVLIKSIHKDAIAVPLGQGHTHYGRYASGIGVNPLKLLSPIKEQKTGELAMYATQVSISKTNQNNTIVKLGATDTQMGRKMVVTIPVEQLKRTEGS